MKKIFITTFITVLIFTIFAVPSFASETEQDILIAEDLTVNVDTDAETTFDEEITAEENPFEYLYNKFSEYSSQILSFMACLFSALIMLCYKKGILPLIKGGLSAISGGVEALSREAEKQEKNTESYGALLNEKLTKAEEVLTSIEKSSADFGKRLEACEGEALLSEQYRSVLLTQIELMFEIFMSASLPQYEKDRIGQMVSDMKAKLNTGVSSCEKTN